MNTAPTFLSGGYFLFRKAGDDKCSLSENRRCKVFRRQKKQTDKKQMKAGNVK